MRCYCGEIDRIKRDIETCESILSKLSRVDIGQNEISNIHKILSYNQSLAYYNLSTQDLINNVKNKYRSFEEMIDDFKRLISSKRNGLKNELRRVVSEDYKYHDEQRRLSLVRE